MILLPARLPVCLCRQNPYHRLVSLRRAIPTTFETDFPSSRLLDPTGQPAQQCPPWRLMHPLVNGTVRLLSPRRRQGPDPRPHRRMPPMATARAGVTPALGNLENAYRPCCAPPVVFRSQHLCTRFMQDTRATHPFERQTTGRETPSSMMSLTTAEPIPWSLDSPLHVTPGRARPRTLYFSIPTTSHFTIP